MFMRKHQLLQLHYSVFLLFTVFYTPFKHVKATASHTFVYASCSQEKYQPNSVFESSRNSFLTSVVSSSSQSPYNSFVFGTNNTDSAIYGLYQCRGDLKTVDCSKCIEGSVSQIGLLCPYAYGASLQLDGCYLRYDHTDFLEKLDTSVVYKKCSKSSVSNDVEFFRRRDDVLADMQSSRSSAAGFRVSGSGLVEGYAQCLGDVNSGDCGSCLGEAVGKLNSLCGSSAAAADVFLAQCYVRYWASGYYDNPSSDSSGNEDDVGKTVSIIVGTVAGLAVLIVLLSFCRRATGGTAK